MSAIWFELEESEQLKRSWLYREILEIPSVVEQARSRTFGAPSIFGKHVFVVARGSSQCAGMAISRLIIKRFGVTCTLLAPSDALLKTDFRGVTALIISQSGVSPDLVEAAQSIVCQGGRAISITNSTKNLLQSVCHENINIFAGPEKSVAATKTFVATVITLSNWLGYSLRYRFFEARMVPMPTCLLSMLLTHQSFVFVGRGFGLGIAKEMALKVQELLGKPALALSSADIFHGPVVSVRESSAVVILSGGEFKKSILGLADKLNLRSGSYISCDLPRWTGAELLILPSFYYQVLIACDLLNRPLDKPLGLNKVTETR